MREILFRGMTYYGKWEQGDLRHGGYVHNDSETYIMRSDYALHNIPVIPETVGQYTGLTDKNGKKIFEGDILSVTVNETRRSDFITEELIELGIYTEADKDRMQNYKKPTGNKIKTVWTVEHKDHFNMGIGFYLYGKNRRFNIRLSKSTLVNADAEVIGNIHDNPELLKEGVDNDL